MSYPSFDFRYQEQQALVKRVAHPTPVTIPSSKNGTQVWLMSGGTFTVRIPKAEYDGPPVLIPEANPRFDPPAWEWHYCCSISVLEFCKCDSKEGVDPLSLLYLDGVPLTAKKSI